VNERAPKRNGRPPLDPRDPSVAVTFRVPSLQYDRLYERARRERSNVADVIRRQLQRGADADDDD
jgi:hypothetical protein